MDYTELLASVEKAKANPKIKNCDLGSPLFEGIPVVLIHPSLEKPTLCVANGYEVTDPAKGSGKPHHVFTFFDGQNVHVKCDDNIINGEKAVSDPAGLQAIQRKALTEAGLSGAALEAMAERVNSATGMTSKDDPCHFWKSFGDGIMCKHVDTVLATHGSELWGQLETAYQKELTPAPVQEQTPLDGLAFKVPILLEGERGVGKTYAVRDFADKHGYTLVELAGHENVEAQDLFGQFGADKTGKSSSGLAWVNGPITEAFESAAKGTKTVLLLDELLRMPQRQLSGLLTALSPDSEGHYRITTNAIDAKTGRREVLRAPVENLCIVATTNVGQGYAVDEIDPAVAERFVPVRVETSLEKIQEVLTKSAMKTGHVEAVPALVSFFEKAQKLQKSGQIPRAPSLRTLERCFLMAGTGTPLSEVKAAVVRQAGLWTDKDSDGLAIASQTRLITTLADSCFSAGRAKTASKDMGR